MYVFSAQQPSTTNSVGGSHLYRFIVDNSCIPHLIALHQLPLSIVLSQLKMCFVVWIRFSVGSNSGNVGSNSGKSNHFDLSNFRALCFFNLANFMPCAAHVDLVPHPMCCMQCCSSFLVHSHYSQNATFVTCTGVAQMGRSLQNPVRLLYPYMSKQQPIAIN